MYLRIAKQGLVRIFVKQEHLIIFKMNFFSYEPQSQLLSATNIQLPQPLSDENLSNANIVEVSLNRAKRYRAEVKNEFKLGNATVQDFQNAEKGQASMETATNMPSIARNVPLFGAAALAHELDALFAPRFNQIDARLNQIDARLNHFDARFEDIRISIINSAIVNETDEITPKLQLLPLPPPGMPPVNPPLPVPDIFPRTRFDLFQLTRENVDILLEYYRIQLAPQTRRPQRLFALAKHLGVSV